MAAVGATLFGLIFVAISIVPESVATANAPLERQIRATTSYVALLNPLVISLFALIPHQQIGIVTIGMSTLGLLNTLGMALTLVRSTGPWQTRIRHSLLILGGFFLYGYESSFAIRLIKSPADLASLYLLADLLIMISIFGVIQAWELIGMRQFRLLNWLSSVRMPKEDEDHAKQDNASQEAGNNPEKPPDIKNRSTK